MLRLFGLRGSPEDLQNNETSSNNIAGDGTTLTTSTSDPNVSPQPNHSSPLLNHNGFDTINLNEDDTISLKQHTDINIKSEDYISSTTITNDNENDNDTTSDNEVNVSHELEWRTVVFIRHGNSIWNESTDNSFRKPLAAIGAFTSGVREYAKLKWSSEYKHEDSIYVDTPLSPKGMKQAYNLSLFLKHHQQLRDQQKLLYLKQHQSIASPIKDAWRALQQYKLEFEQKQREQQKNDNNNTTNKGKQFSSLCDDALESLTKAMQSVEHLMANAKPRDPNTSNHTEDIDNLKDENNNYYNVPMDISSIMDILIGKNVKSRIVCSNLRRAISTCVLSLWHRLRFTTEKIYILSCLQEIGVNVDTHTHTAQFQVPQVSNFEMMSENLDSKTLNDFYSTRIETIYNYGSKSEGLMESQQDSQKRLELFAKWIFMKDHDRKNGTNDEEKDNDKGGFKTIKTDEKNSMPPAVIAVGHSAWIRHFFRNYLPSKSEFIGKNTKLSNCGVVAFKFYYDKHRQKFGIAPNTITVVYKGFGAS